MPKQADIFLVPLLDGAYGVGQIVVCPPDAPVGTRACLFTQRRTETVKPQSPINVAEGLALILISDELLKDKTWPIVGFEAIPPVDRVFKLKAAIKARFDKVAIQDPAVVEAFVNAIQGLYPWNGFPDPEFFTKLLVHPDRVPATAKSKAAFG